MERIITNYICFVETITITVKYPSCPFVSIGVKASLEDEVVSLYYSWLVCTHHYVLTYE